VAVSLTTRLIHPALMPAIQAPYQHHFALTRRPQDPEHGGTVTAPGQCAQPELRRRVRLTTPDEEVRPHSAQAPSRDR